MSTQVMNSAMMPAEGQYSCRAISQREFVSILVNSDEIVSSIGYQSTIQLIQRISGITLPISRDMTVLSPDDVILVIKLKYRIDNPAKKKDWKPLDEDYEYFLVEYCPHGHHRIHIDVEDYGPSNSVYFNLWIDDLPWFGSVEDQQRISTYVWIQVGCPDLYNDYHGGASMSFNSDDEFVQFMMKARLHGKKNVA